MHPLYTGSIGHAEQHLKHPEILLDRDPLVVSFTNHRIGTNPFWYDLSWFRDHTTTHFYLRGHLHRLVPMFRETALFVVDELALPLLLCLLLIMGARLPSWWREPQVVLLAAWALLQLGLYISILVYARYLTVLWFACLLPTIVFT